MVDIQRGRIPTRPTRATPASSATKSSLGGRQAAIPGGTPSGVGFRKPTSSMIPMPRPGTGTGTSAVLQEQATPQPQNQFYSDNSYGGFSGAPADMDYTAGDPTYLATLAALESALKLKEANIEADRKKYDVDYDESLRTIGYRKPVGTEGSPDFKAGDFDREDLTTASGKAYQNMVNDFASRGLLQSSLYARSSEDLMRQLGNQVKSVDTARSNFMDELDRTLKGLRAEDTQQRQQARLTSIGNLAGSF